MSDEPSLPQYPQGPPSGPRGQAEPGPYPRTSAPQAGYPGAAGPSAYPGATMPPGGYPGGPYPGPPPGAQQTWGGPAAWQQPPPKAARPSTVARAVQLMYIGPVLTVVNIIIALTQISAVRHQIESQQPSWSTSQVNQAVDIAIGIIVVAALIGAGLWVMCAVACAKGHNWGRVVGTVFWGIDTLLVLVAFSQTSPSGNRFTGLVVWALGLAIVVLLWRRQSSDYFAASANYRRSGGR